MMNILRTTAAVAALALTTTPALAASPAKQASATARIVKPLSIVWEQDLAFGEVTLVDTGPTTITVARDGTRNCPGSAVTCSGASSAAWYKVTGTQNQVVTVTAGNVSMVGPANSTPLLVTVNAPPTLNIGNSGTAGADLLIGGSITVGGGQAEGDYLGTFAVTVNY